MLTDTAVTVLSDRRKRAPYGAQGGESAKPGINTVITSQGTHTLGGKATLALAAGDRLRIETPGGGGFGSPESAA
jgi:N-methylhydantoinase B